MTEKPSLRRGYLVSHFVPVTRTKGGFAAHFLASPEDRPVLPWWISGIAKPGAEVWVANEEWENWGCEDRGGGTLAENKVGQGFHDLLGL